MKRRDFLAVLGAAACSPALSQNESRGRMHRIGFLSPGTPISDDDERGSAFIRAISQRGYERGRNMVISRRAAMGRLDQLSRLVQELVTDQTEVIVTTGFPTALAAKHSGLATVAANGVGDPVATGLIQSLAHPGENLTGISDEVADLTRKRLAFLKEIAPNLRRIAMLWNKDDLGMTLRYEASAAEARALRVEVQALGVREPDDFEEAFAAMDRDMPDAILMVSDSLTVLNRKRVLDFAAAHHLPAMFEFELLVRDGGLMSYGSDLAEGFERAANLVSQILKGRKAGDLPFEHPTRYKLAINLRTARSMGLDVSPQLLARADEVIE